MKEIINLSEQDIIYDILKRYSEKKASQSIDDFLVEELDKAKIFSSKKEIEENVEIISNVIKTNSSNFKEIKKYKENGKSSALWLRDIIDKVTGKFNSNARDSLIENIKKSLSSNNQNLLNVTTGNNINNPVEPLINTDFSDINKNIIAENLKDEIKLNTELKTIVLDSAFEAISVKKEK